MANRPGQGVGARRTRVQVQRLTGTPDALAQVIQTWTTVATIWARKRALSGGELTNALQTKAVVNFVLECTHPRSLVTVTPADAVLIAGVQYGVEWTNDLDDRHATLLIYCKEPIAPAS